MKCLVGLALSVGAVGQAIAVGPGVRAGDWVINPSASVSGGLDDNVFMNAESEGGGPFSATFLFVGGGVKLSNRNPRYIGLKLDTGLTYRHFTSLDEVETGSGVNSDALIESRNGLSDAKAGLNIALAPRSSVSLELVEDFRYTERPPYEAVVAGFQKVDNSVGMDLRFRPGPVESRAFEMRLGYRLHTVNFLDHEQVNAGAAEKLAHETRFLTQWKFLPKTALLLDVRFDVIDYENVSRQALVIRDRDSKPLRVMAGVQGLVTKRVSVVLKGGFINTFNVVGESYAGPAAVAEVKYVFEPTLTLGAGYERDARDSNYSNFYVVDRVFARGQIVMFTRLSLDGRVSFDHYRYSESGSPALLQGEDFGERTDPFLRAKVGLTYAFQEWLDASVSYSRDHNMSDFVSPPDVEPERQDRVEFVRQVFMLTVAANY